MYLNKNELSVLKFVGGFGDNVPIEYRHPSGIAKACKISIPACNEAILALKGFELIKADGIVHEEKWLVMWITPNGRQLLRERAAKRTDMLKDVLVFTIKDVVVPILVSGATAYCVAKLALHN